MSSGAPQSALPLLSQCVPPAAPRITPPQYGWCHDCTAVGWGHDRICEALASGGGVEETNGSHVEALARPLLGRVLLMLCSLLRHREMAPQLVSSMPSLPTALLTIARTRGKGVRAAETRSRALHSCARLAETLGEGLLRAGAVATICAILDPPMGHRGDATYEPSLLSRRCDEASRGDDAVARRRRWAAGDGRLAADYDGHVDGDHDLADGDHDLDVDPSVVDAACAVVDAMLREPSVRLPRLPSLVLPSHPVS